MKVPNYIVPYLRIEIKEWTEKQKKKASSIGVEEMSLCGESSKKMSLQEWLDKHKLIGKEDGGITSFIKPLNVDKEVIDKVVNISWSA